MNMDNNPTVVTTCCILNNMCKINGVTFKDLWMEDVNYLEQPVSVGMSALTTERGKII